MIDPTNYVPVLCFVGVPQMWTCRRCGALVLEEATQWINPAGVHDDWHDALALDLARRSS